MKKIIVSLIVLFALINVTKLTAQTSYDFNTGIELAKSTNKLIIINIYKPQNSWFKKMESEVYSSGKVSGALNNYVYIKLDADGSQTYTYNGKSYSAGELSRVLGATGYPTHIIMTPDGKVLTYKYNGEMISSFPGFIDEENFVEFLNFFYEGTYKDNDLIIIFQN
jgi:thioredoxin-related protein